MLRKLSLRKIFLQKKKQKKQKQKKHAILLMTPNEEKDYYLAVKNNQLY